MKKLIIYLSLIATVGYSADVILGSISALTWKGTGADRVASFGWKATVACVFNGTSDYLDTGITYAVGDNAEIYIETNIKDAEDSNFHYYMCVFQNDGDFPIFGFGKNNASSAGFFGYNIQLKTFPITNGWTFITCSRIGGTWEGNEYNYSSTPTTNSITRPLYIGTANNAGTAWSATWAQLDVTRWQIVKNGVLVQDCKAQSNGTFKDDITGNTFTKAGGGALSTIDVSTINLTTRSWFN